MENIDIVNMLAQEIVEQRKKQLQRNNKRFIPRNFYASSIPECTRQMVHSILDWDKKELADDGLLALFESGKKEENNIVKMLLDMGFEFIEQQNPIEIKNREGETICTGRIDGKIVYKGLAIPCEIKTMQDYVFQKINKIEDFENSALHRKYIKQIQLYMFGNNIEVGMFIISNFRQIKVIPVYLNYELCEQILQQIEKAWGYVKKKEYPDPIQYNPQICDWCPFELLCTKTTLNKPADFIDNKELEGLLDRRKELENAYTEYKVLDEQIKKPFANNSILHAIIGTKWEIIGRKQTRTAYNTKLLDTEILEKIKEVKEIFVYKIKKLG